MERNIRPEPGKIYRHFKNKLYQIVTVAIHSETGEELVIYQALYGEFKIYARPLCMFTSMVDKNKYPSVTQKYRFEQITPNLDNIGNTHEETSLKSQGVNPDLLKFLEANSYEEKLDIFLGMEKTIDEKILKSISVSLDLVLNEGSLKEQYESIKNCLMTYDKFENKRLR